MRQHACAPPRRRGAPRAMNKMRGAVLLAARALPRNNGAASFHAEVLQTP